MGKSTNPYDLLAAGKAKSAIRIFKHDFDDEPAAGEAMSLGLAYLWTADYPSAWEHFTLAHQIATPDNDSFYSMAGIAKWCLNETKAAIKEWEAGLKCGYTDGAGGVTLPLCLYFASVMRPKAFSRQDAEQLLLKKTKRGWIRNWPGPIAQFVVGLIDECKLRSACAAENPDWTNVRQWQASFHIAVVKRAHGKRVEFKKDMQKIADLSSSEYATNRDDFLEKLGHEEFYLARHEARKK